MRRLATSALLSLALLAFALPLRAAERPHLVYSGHLLQEEGAALGGIYPLEFSLHTSPDSTKKLWTERHWVSVEDGVYTVRLGLQRALPRRLETAGTYVSISLPGGPELARDPLSERNLPGHADDATAPLAPEPTGPTARGGAVDYAEKAGLAYEAEQCRNADAVGNLSLEQLDERFRKKAGGARLGASQRYSGAAGGEGGRPFRLMCPKGYVAVGVRGAAGIYLDSIEVVCAPLE